MAKLILLALLGLLCHAYTPKDIELGPGNFSRYVRPQLQSLLTEYNSLYIALNEPLASFKPAMELYREVSGTLEKISSGCATINTPQCLNLLEQLGEAIKQQLVLVDSLSYTPSATQDFDQYLIGLDLLAKYKMALTDTYLQIDARVAEFLIKGPLSLSSSAVVNWADNLDYRLHMFLLSQVDARYESILSAFWLDFIRPVQQNVLPRNNLKFFRERLTELNIRWNELHYSLTKRNIKVSGQANSIMAIMHNRWNSILKVSLKPL